MKLQESRLLFDFDDNKWTDLIRFDEHIDYKNVKKNVPETKGVDFIGILNQKSIYFFEIKNFSNQGIEDGDKLKFTSERIDEIAQKVRDTVSCVVGGFRNSTNNKQEWSKILEFIMNKNIFIVFWLEQDNVLNTNKLKISNYQLKLKSKLKWLTGSSNNIRIFNTNNYENNLYLNIKNY